MKKPRYIYYTEVYIDGQLVDARVAFHPQQFHQLKRVSMKFGSRRSVTCVRFSFGDNKWEPYEGG